MYEEREVRFDPAARAAHEAAAVQAFGALPNTRRYRLGRARFPWMSDQLAALAAVDGRALRVLDAGVGQAKLARVHLARHAEQGVRWHGLDRLRFRLQLRPELALARVQADLEGGLPYPDGAFDAAVCSWVLQHLARPEAAVAELARVVRPGGLVLLAVPNSPPPLKALQERLHPLWNALRARLGKRRSYRAQVQFYDLARLRALAQGAGLAPERLQGFGFPISGGLLGFLEDHAWYYRLNLRFGARWPGLTQQLVCAARR